MEYNKKKIFMSKQLYNQFSFLTFFCWCFQFDYSQMNLTLLCLIIDYFGDTIQIFSLVPLIVRPLSENLKCKKACF